MINSDSMIRLDKKDPPNKTSKHRQSDEIARQVDEFLAKGGQINAIPIIPVPVLKIQNAKMYQRFLAKEQYTRAQARKNSRATPSARRWNGSNGGE